MRDWLRYRRRTIATTCAVAAVFFGGGYGTAKVLDDADQVRPPTPQTLVAPAAPPVEGIERVLDEDLYNAARALSEITGVKTPRATDDAIIDALAACLEGVTATVARYKLLCQDIAEIDQARPSAARSRTLKLVALRDGHMVWLAAKLTDAQWHRVRTAIDSWNAAARKANAVGGLREIPPAKIVRLQRDVTRARQVLQGLPEG